MDCEIAIACHCRHRRHSTATAIEAAAQLSLFRTRYLQTGHMSSLYVNAVLQHACVTSCCKCQQNLNEFDFVRMDNSLLSLKGFESRMDKICIVEFFNTE